MTWSKAPGDSRGGARSRSPIITDTRASIPFNITLLPASRILVRGRKQIAAPARLARGLVLHRPDGRLTDQVEAVLREGSGLDL